MKATSELTAPGHIGVRSALLEEWNSYATRLLGMQRVDRAGAVRAFRMLPREPPNLGNRATCAPAYGAICCHLSKPKNQTDDIFLAQILGHKLLGPNAALSVGLSYKDFYVVEG